MTRTHVATAWLLGVWLLGCACTGGESPPGPTPGPDPLPGAPLIIATEALPRARQGLSYEAVMSAQGGTGTTRAWSVVQGQLPEGLTLEGPSLARPRIVGIPRRAGVQEFVLALEGEQGQRTTRTLRLDVDSSLARTGSTLWEATEGASFPAEARATGGSGTGHRWSVVSGELPPGLALAPRGDILRFLGTPAPGRFQFTLAVEDSDGTRVERLAELRVRSSLTILGEPPTAARTHPYSARFDVVGGIAPYRWTLVDAETSGGMRLSCETCATASLVGEPRAEGYVVLVLRVEDANGGAVERRVRLRVVEPLELVPEPLPPNLHAAPYSARLVSRGGVGDKRWFITGGELPPGVTLTGEGDTALLSGSGRRAGLFSFRVRVIDSVGFTDERPYSVRIDPNPPRIVTAVLPDGAMDQPYEAKVEGVTPVGGTVRWKLISGWLPPGVELKNTQPASLTLSGVARVAGTFPVTVELADDGGVARATYTVRIGYEERFQVRSSVLPDARVGTAYTARVQTSAAEGSVGGWTVVDGALPSGVSVQAEDEGGARLTGTPGTAGFYRFALQASDAAGHTSRKDFVLQVAPARRWAVLAHSTSFLGARTMTVVDLNDRTGQTRWQMGIASEAYDFTFSSDGAWFSYSVGDLSRKSLYLADLRVPGSTASRVADNLRGDRGGPATYSPDGRWMAYSVMRGAQSLAFDQYVRDLSGSRGTTRLHPSDWTTEYGQVWSPDGTRLLLHSSDGTRFQLWTTEGAAHTLPVTPEVSRIQWPFVWTPDSRGVVFGATRSDATQPYSLFRLDLSQPGSARPLPLTPPDLGFNPNFTQTSPDGTRLAFIGEREGSRAVYVLELGNGPPRTARQVSGSMSEVWDVSWSPDSRHLLMLQSADATYVADVEAAEGAQPTRLATPGLGPSRQRIQWTSDGVHVLYVSDEGLSFVRAVGSPSVTTVFASPLPRTDYVLLPGAGRRLVYSSGGLHLVDPDGPPRGPVRLDTAGSLEYFSQSDLERTGDLLYHNLNTSPRALWWVDVRGPEPTAPVQLLDFGQGLVSVRTY